MAPSPPRDRATSRLARLTAEAAAAGALLQTQACDSCNPVVCDPLPPPIACEHDPTTAELSQQMTWSVTWVTDGAGLAVQLDVTSWSGQVRFAGPPNAVGGSPVSAEVARDRLIAVFAPDPEAVAIQVEIPVTCDGAAEALRARLDVAATPAAGEEVDLTLLD